jgi:hypothetical protein
MNVKELKHLLEDIDDDVLVILSHDADGNRFSPLASHTMGFYIEEDGYSGDFVTEEEVEEDKRLNIDGASASIALWPTD